MQSLRNATENSVNCATSGSAPRSASHKVVEMAKRLGVTHPINPANYSLSIGSSTACRRSTWPRCSHVRGRRRPARPGVHHEGRGRRRQGDLREQGRGRPGDRSADRPHRHRRAARRHHERHRQAGQALPARSPRARPARPTTRADAWFVGYTPQLVAAVWMGDPAAVHADAARRVSSARCSAARTRRSSGRSS